MTTIVFLSNYIQIPIPVSIGITRVHIANGICILSGILFGPLAGGFAAGFCSFLFDLTMPAFVMFAPLHSPPNSF